jgi:hypothetical protein
LGRSDDRTIRAESATMTTAKVTTRRQKEHDRLAWMEGVKVLRAPEVLGRFAFKMEEVSKDGAGGEASTFESSEPEARLGLVAEDACRRTSVMSKALGSRCP